MPARRSTKLVGLALGLLLLAAALVLSSRPVTAPPARLPLTGRVTRVYDGDTIEVAGVGKVRLIGIDAMDGYNERRMLEQAQRYGMGLGRVRHWAVQATEFAREMLQGRRMTLEPGEQRADAYGRLLAYVRLESGEDFNLLMLRKGLAAAYHAFPHPRRQEYLRAEKAAREAGLGLWQDARNRP